jgi:hypothetical protein
MNPVDDLVSRLRRIYAAIGEAGETDISKFSPTIFQNDRMLFLWQDFRGGLSHEQLLNLAFSLAYNVFNLRDHLKKWAKAHCGSDHRVKDFFKQSTPLMIIADLSNSDKHGYPLDRPWTTLAPKLGDVTRPLRLTPKAGAGWLLYTVGADGKSKTLGEGNAEVVLSVDVLDKDDNRIGDLVEIAEQAVTDWEKLLVELGITLNPTP